MKLTKLLTAFFMLIFFSSIGMSACVINIESPLDDTYITDSTPDFVFNVTGEDLTYNVTLYVNGVIYGNSATAINDTQTTITPTTNVLMINTWYLYSLNQTSGLNCTSSIYDLDYGTTKFRGMSKLIGFIKDIVGIVPDLIRLAIYGGILTIVGVMITVIAKWIKTKGII